MAVGTLAIVVSVGGVTINKTVTKTADHPNVFGDANTQIMVGPATAAASWTNGTSTVALTAGHGLTTGTYDVYWSAGSKCRYGCTGTVTSNSMVLSGGAGDSLPATDPLDMLVCKQQQINTAIDGDLVALFAANCSQRAHLTFKDSGASVIAAMNLLADQPTTWHDTSNVANPLTGNPITVCYASCGSLVAGVLTILSLEDSTP